MLYFCYKLHVWYYLVSVLKQVCSTRVCSFVRKVCQESWNTWKRSRKHQEGRVTVWRSPNISVKELISDVASVSPAVLFPPEKDIMGKQGLYDPWFKFPLNFQHPVVVSFHNSQTSIYKDVLSSFWGRFVPPNFWGQKTKIHLSRRMFSKVKGFFFYHSPRQAGLPSYVFTHWGSH